MIRLRARNIHRRVAVPGPELGHERPALRDAAMQPPRRGGIGPLGAAGQHGDRRPVDGEHAAVSGGVDPPRHPADHGHAGAAQSASEGAGDLHPVGRRLAGADDGHRLTGDQLPEPAGPPDDVQHRGRRRQVAQPTGYAGSQRHTASSPASAQCARATPASKARYSPVTAPARAAGDRRDQFIVAELQQRVDPVADLVEMAGQPPEQPRAPQAAATGTTAAHLPCCPVSGGLGHASTIASTPER